MHLWCCNRTQMIYQHSTEKPVTTILTYPWKCTVSHCNHLGNTWKPLVLMTRHFDYCPSASEGDNQSVRSSAPVVSRCFPGGYNVKLYISRGRLAWWLLTFLHSADQYNQTLYSCNSWGLSSFILDTVISYLFWIFGYCDIIFILDIWILWYHIYFGYWGITRATRWCQCRLYC